jgi:hypothetical protein
MIQKTSSLDASKERIFHQLEHMMANPQFNVTPQLVALLKFVVNRKLEGNADSTTEYTIATEVFGRRSDFDPSIDPIASIQANRLRLALVRYYQNSGKNDPILINIPRGTYVPVFKKQK